MTEEEWVLLQAFAAASELCLVAVAKDGPRFAQVPTFNPNVHRLLRHTAVEHAPAPIPRLARALPSQGLALARRRAWADMT